MSASGLGLNAERSIHLVVVDLHGPVDVDSLEQLLRLRARHVRLFPRAQKEVVLGAWLDEHYGTTRVQPERGYSTSRVQHHDGAAAAAGTRNVSRGRLPASHFIGCEARCVRLSPRTKRVTHRIASWPYVQ